MTQEVTSRDEKSLFQIKPGFTFSYLAEHIFIDLMLAFLIVGLLLLPIHIYQYLWARSAMYTLTNKSLSVDAGVMFKSRSALQLGPFVQAVTYSEGPTQKIWGVGNIRLVLLPTALQSTFTLRWVPEPAKYCQLIQNALSELSEG